MRGFSIPATARVWIYDEPVNMGSSFPNLTKLAGETDGEITKDMFLFVNKKKTYVKVLYFAKNGWCIFAKMLPEGTFRVTRGGKIALVDMHRILDEVSFAVQIKQLKKAA